MNPPVTDANWTEWGELPTFDPSTEDRLTADQLALLMEDIWRLESPSKDRVFDVGWYPEGDADGAFRCRRVENRDWRHPVLDFRTRSLAEVTEWVRAARDAADPHTELQITWAVVGQMMNAQTTDRQFGADEIIRKQFGPSGVATGMSDIRTAATTRWVKSDDSTEMNA